MRAKIISSLEKCFLEDNMDTKQSVTSGSMLKNENYQFQICYTMKMLSDGSKFIDLKVNSPISDYITLYKIQHKRSLRKGMIINEKPLRCKRHKKVYPHTCF